MTENIITHIERAIDVCHRAKSLKREALLTVLTLGRDDRTCGERDQVLAHFAPVFENKLDEFRKSNSKMWLVPSWTVVTLLSALGNSQAEDFLFERLGDKEQPNSSQHVAAICLGVVGGSRVVDRLISVLEDSNAARHGGVYAARALGDIADSRAVPALMTFLEKAKYYSGSGNIEGDVVVALCKIGDPRFLTTLLSRMRSRPSTNTNIFPDEYLRFLKSFPTQTAPIAIDALANPKTVTSWFVALLTDILSENAAALPQEDLRALASRSSTVEGGNFKWQGGDEYGGMYSTGYRTVDCSKLRELASQELSKRGLPVPDATVETFPPPPPPPRPPAAAPAPPPAPSPRSSPAHPYSSVVNQTSIKKWWQFWR